MNVFTYYYIFIIYIYDYYFIMCSQKHLLMYVKDKGRKGRKGGREGGRKSTALKIISNYKQSQISIR